MTDDVAECFRCGAPATESFGGAALRTDYIDAVEADPSVNATVESPERCSKVST